MNFARRQNCSGHSPVTRRHFLFGAATAASTSLVHAHPDAEVAQSATTPLIKNTAQTCVFINLNGAPSHLDLWDPKDGPWNPRDADIRQHPGGMVLSNRYLPNISRLAGDLLLLHSVQSWENAHERGQFYMQTGHPSNPAFATEIPHIGAVVSNEKGARGLVPPFMSFNQGIQGATFLGGLYQPMMPPAQRTGIATLRHDHFGAASQDRFNRRFRLLETLDAPIRQNPWSQGMADYASFYNTARGMMYNDPVAQVFQYSADDEGRYGNTAVGRSLLITRNAIRAKNGARFINVSMGGWDLHDTMFDTGRGGNFYALAGDLDRALFNFVQDLKASGDFNNTLIVLMGEFGRTPGNLNSRGGRDHWKDAMSVALLGGGVKGGRVIGAKNGTGSAITDPGWSGNRPIYTEDVAATIYSALGIDCSKSISDTPSGRKYVYVPGAAEGRYQPIPEVWG